MEKEWTYGKWEGRICIWFLLEFVSVCVYKMGSANPIPAKAPGENIG